MSSPAPRLSRIYTLLLGKLDDLMDAWVDVNNEKVFITGKGRPFKKRFGSPRKSVPLGHFPCYFRFVTSGDVNWSSFPKNIQLEAQLRVVFYKRIWDKDNVDQTQDLYFWSEELMFLVNNYRRWDGCCNNGVQMASFTEPRFNFEAEGNELFFMADCRINLVLRINMIT